MPIDPRSVKWDDEPAVIDPASIQWDDAPAAPQEAKPKAEQGTSLGQHAGNLLAGAVRGAGSIGATILAPYDIAKDALAGKGLSLESNRERRAGIDGGLRELGADTDSMMYQGGKIAGEIAGTAGAGGVLANGARALGASAPVVQGLSTGGLNVAGRAGFGGLLTRGVTGAVVGGATAGMVNPDDAGVGAMIGGGLPVVAKGAAEVARRTGGGLSSIVAPLHSKGRETIVGRALREFAGDKVDDAVARLSSAQSAVPGVQLTVGEAAGVPSLAALQRASVNVSPEAANAMTERLAANNQARLELLESMAGRNGAREAALQARDEAAAAGYKAAREADEARILAARQAQSAQQQVVDDAAGLVAERFAGLGSLANAPKVIAPKVPSGIEPSAELRELAQRPAMRAVLNKARELAANKGQEISDPLTSIDGLHNVKLALDDALDFSPTSSLGRNERAALASMKARLIEEMDKISPAYGAEREAFAKASKPINQMDIAEELLKAANPLTGSLRGTQFASKLSDQTARKATGFKGATLDGVMSPEQLAQLNAIKSDLLMLEAANNSGRAAGTNTVQNLAYGNMLGALGVPNFLRNSAVGQVTGGVLQRGADAIYAGANQRVAQQLAEALLDPKEAARLMTRAGRPAPLLRAVEGGAKKGLLGVGRAAPVLIAQ